MRKAPGRLIVFLALLIAFTVSPQHEPERASPTEPRFCPGEYAEDLSALSPAASEVERHHAAYTFCVRTTATYECPFYDSEGALKLSKLKVTAHGTAFAYQQKAGETLLLTNQHIADWPQVTDDEHKVDDVPRGCRRTSDTLRLVDGESDEYERDDISLTRVVSDPQLDVAVLKARATLGTMPWRVGRSSTLRERTAVFVRGFPLGTLKATNVGKVVSAYDKDTFKEWDHDDFVVDALLSTGNSGSPVLAVSCRTGEFELVGIYHAGYSRAAALNVVVSIDQVRDLMTTLKRSPRRSGEPGALDAASRHRVVELASGLDEPFFSFGGLPVRVRPRSDGALLFEVLGRDFPFSPAPIMVVEDLAPSEPGAFGSPGRVFFGNARGLRGYQRGDLDAEAQGQLARVLEGLRATALAQLSLQHARRTPVNSRESAEQLARQERAARKAVATQAPLAAALSELSDRHDPGPVDDTMSLADLTAPPTSPPEPPGAPAAAAHP